MSKTFLSLIKISLKLPSIGLDNDLALNRWQAITWSSADLIHSPIYSALVGNEFMLITKLSSEGALHGNTSDGGCITK